MKAEDYLSRILSLNQRKFTIETPPGRIEEVTGVGVVTSYIGYPKRSNSATSAAEWGIMRVVETTAGTTVTTVRTWADGDIEKDNIWDNRATLTYSYLA